MTQKDQNSPQSEVTEQDKQNTTQPDTKYTEYVVNLALANDKDSLMTLLQDSLQLPDYFGHNWDALHDVLTDSAVFAGNTKVTLQNHYVFVKKCPELEKTLMHILSDVAEEWHDRATDFILAKS